MKRNISNPNLTDAITALVEKINPVTIICFGFHSSATTAWSCFGHESASSRFHYDLLIVRREKDKRKETEIIHEAGKVCTDGLSLFVISHSEDAVKKALGAGDSFFHTVFREGTTLYGDLNFEPGLNNSEPILRDASAVRRESGEKL